MSESDPRLANSPASTRASSVARNSPACARCDRRSFAGGALDRNGRQPGRFQLRQVFSTPCGAAGCPGWGSASSLASLVAALLLFLIPETYEAFVIIRVYRDREQMLRDKYQRGVHPAGI